MYNFDYWSGHTSFRLGTAVRLGSIEQKHKNAWTTFILDKSEGLTRAGIERINDSVRTYVWCLLGSQAQTRSGIMDSSTGFDAQKQYLANLEDSINSAVDLPSSIKRYEDVLRYARSKVDFAVGGGLYMLPSDLRLQMGTIINYNNEILIAGDEQKLGQNKYINNTPAIIINKESSRPPPQAESPRLKVNALPPDSHEYEKTALIVVLVGIGLIGLYFTKKKSSD